MPFFLELLDTITRRLRAALPVDAVYICSHGAGLTTEEDDPDGVLFERVREIVGPDVPIAATLDLHANVSDRMVRSIDVFIGYRTNPHLDMRERGAEAAAAIREMLGGVKPQRALVRLPIVPPTVTMLTATGPYAEMIDFGQRRMSPEIMNVSVMGGFAFADTAKNGLSVVVTARHDKRAAETLALDIAELGWANRARFYPAADLARRGCREGARGGPRPFAAGARLCRCRRQPGRRRARQHDFSAARLRRSGCPRRAARRLLRSRSCRRGAPARSLARSSRRASTGRRPRNSQSRTPPRATVVSLTDGKCVGRRGIYAGLRLELGPCAALQLGGVTVVVISHRVQCADPIFFEMMGLDIHSARSVVVKSRGHFRGGFDEFFGPGQIVEVDLPGLTSPMLSRFEWAVCRAPVIPLDDNVEWVNPYYCVSNREFLTSCGSGRCNKGISGGSWRERR